MFEVLTLGKALIVCGLAVLFGAVLIWRGATGDIWRSRFTGDAIIPAWLYVSAGVFVILLALGWVAAAYFLGKA